MRRLDQSEHGFRVEISAAAWSHVGSLPSIAFEAIRNELQAVAQAAGQETELSAAETAGDPSGAVRCLRVDRFIAVYQIDRAMRTVVLLEIARRMAVA